MVGTSVIPFPGRELMKSDHWVNNAHTNQDRGEIDGWDTGLHETRILVVDCGRKNRDISALKTVEKDHFD
jgi:hypothetical protein